MHTGEIPALTEFKERVHPAAEAALIRHDDVTLIDVLCGMGLLASSAFDSWRKGASHSGVRNRGKPEKIPPPVIFLNRRHAQCSKCEA